jgi:Fe-S cluster biosynthesis and repair protein YggX
MTTTKSLRCRRCGEMKAAMEKAPMPGRWGAVAHEQTCAACWREWVEEQTRLINHMGLKTWQPEDRAKLYELMREYLKLEATEAGS